MKDEQISDEKPIAIFIFCLLYAFHMVEEFTIGFVEWADRYLGSFDWTQNLIGNAVFFVCLAFACYLYYKNSTKYLWVGMSAAMWVLANSFIHISTTILGGEYSPGVVTATVLYIPGGLYFLVNWARKGLLTWKNVLLSFAVGGMVFMLIPTFTRAVLLHAELAKIFYLVR
ncbi:MAG: HXXEE domain-containing protein [Pseudomonadota bacterium]